MNKKEEFFEELSKQLDFSIDEYVEVEDIEDYDELYEQLEDKDRDWETVWKNVETLVIRS